MGGRHRRLQVWIAITAGIGYFVALLGFVTDAASWVDKLGLGRVIAVLVGGACLLTYIGLRISKPIRHRTALSIVTAVAVVASCVAFIYIKSPPKASTAVADPVTPPPVTTVVVPPDPRKTGCGSDAKETASVPDVEICVVYWCTGAVYSVETGGKDPTQLQYKIRPRIYNSTDQPVNISINSPSPLRLIVDSPQLDQRWAPPQNTIEAGDSVYPVLHDGKRYWAVPPNAVGGVVEVGGYWSGFATFWDRDELEANGVYPNKLRFDSEGNVIQEGDLVFQLPTNPDGSDPDVLGLAYVTGGGNAPMNIEHIFLKDEHWPESSQPNSF
ncbi:hypothetical protein [Mycolicibacterium fortuitum]|uniref:hypothetical protein n=1 Tax=Mycolicibacterium fortuitum TaxID=1766 RepID=UPI001CDD2F13|nr:hypothetical protein [Mycolicibacterium fortuitum]UBV17765.1 hypothetical protein H8Z57_13835 [Mycolicibacterium fortuitum]